MGGKCPRGVIVRGVLVQGRRGAVVKGVEHVSTIVLVNI